MRCVSLGSPNTEGDRLTARPRRPWSVARVLRSIGQRVSPPLGGQLHRLPVSLTFGLTGPFNGQRRRATAVREIFARVPFQVVIETGTFLALTTTFLRGLTSAPIATIEINPDYHLYSRRRLRNAQGVECLLGDSPEVLARLADEPALTSGPVFFYLDAHWLDHLPLLDELRVIRRGWPEFVALIDDFRVEGDDGYGYDDYGPGKSIELDLLALPELADLHLFWPAQPASRETGTCRGWVVLATPTAMAEALTGLTELRPGGTVGAALGGARLTMAAGRATRPPNRYHRKNPGGT
jgi:hypothetical protein